ncbi:MAG TPA: tetratricopeptide repeat protein [Puia sp.]|nr:tetratricopeptide repeat protein [Puia sp.]
MQRPLLIGQGRKKESIDVLKYNLEAHPNSAYSYEGLAEEYDDMGEKELAIQYYKKVLELNPKHAYAARRLKELSPTPAR